MLLSKYYQQFDCNCPLKEYPRPQLVRDSYLCLNGQWDLSISKTETFPKEYKNSITVPYCIESVLSGVFKNVSDDEYIFYRKKIIFDKKFIKDKVILHIDALDQIGRVYVNKRFVIESNNGYLPIIVDIKPYLLEGENEIVIMAIDKLSHDYPYGKQRKDRGGMWYTPVSGIWQSVWVESVFNDYIKDLTITPDIDNSKVSIILNSCSEEFNLIIYENGKQIYNETKNIPIFDIYLDNVILWTPENPFLYDVVIKTKNDEVKTYFAMRKFSADNKNIMLNNKPIFLHGLLDQGYFPDGIYTPATYEAYKDDILTMKRLGFNCLRKHIKIEPLMFYHFCDKYGMIILQDFVNNGQYSFFKDTALPTIGLNKLAYKFKKTNENVKEIFKESAINTLNYLYNVPCIGYITIFNEGWGQHDADKYYEIVKQIDDSRIIDSTSGWFKENLSDVLSLHVYFKKIKLPKSDKPIIVSEFGGYAIKIEDHIFNDKKDYGYKKFENLNQFNQAIKDLYENDVIANIKNGLCGAIYTQVSDVEDEINGLLTYDRKVLKVDEKMMKEISNKINEEFSND